MSNLESEISMSLEDLSKTRKKPYRKYYPKKQNAAQQTNSTQPNVKAAESQGATQAKRNAKFNQKRGLNTDGQATAMDIQSAKQVAVSKEIRRNSNSNVNYRNSQSAPQTPQTNRNPRNSVQAAAAAGVKLTSPQRSSPYNNHLRSYNRRNSAPGSFNPNYGGQGQRRWSGGGGQRPGGYQNRGPKGPAPSAPAPAPGFSSSRAAPSFNPKALPEMHISFTLSDLHKGVDKHMTQQVTSVLSKQHAKDPSPSAAINAVMKGPLPFSVAQVMNSVGGRHIIK